MVTKSFAIVIPDYGEVREFLGHDYWDILYRYKEDFPRAIRDYMLEKNPDIADEVDFFYPAVRFVWDYELNLQYLNIDPDKREGIFLVHPWKLPGRGEHDRIGNKLWNFVRYSNRYSMLLSPLYPGIPEVVLDRTSEDMLRGDVREEYGLNLKTDISLLEMHGNYIQEVGDVILERIQRFIDRRGSVSNLEAERTELLEHEEQVA